MTAILQPGDKIHLAFGLGTTDLKGNELHKFAESELQQYVRSYGKQGVQVVQWTASSALTAPVVVAIFRAPANQSSTIHFPNPDTAIPLAN